MADKIIKWLEENGYSFCYVTEETEKNIFFRGEDSRGLFLEFQFTKADGYLMDRAVGSKYWDILEKLSFE
jgi:hypothetical protein